MTALVVPWRMTARQFATLPDPEHGGKMELVHGRVVIMPPVGPDHGERATRLILRLGAFTESRRLGVLRTETGYWITESPDSVRAPDVSFVSDARRRTEQVVEGFVEQPPDLAIEVISPSQTEPEVLVKVNEYLAAGVARVWTVNPKVRTVTVHFGPDNAVTFGPGSTLTSHEAGFAVEGFELLIDDLFS
jgi:Uma2 family endonuclease